jgi:hypothetical protein
MIDGGASGWNGEASTFSTDRSCGGHYSWGSSPSSCIRKIAARREETPNLR